MTEDGAGTAKGAIGKGNPRASGAASGKTQWFKAFGKARKRIVRRASRVTGPDPQGDAPEGRNKWRKYKLPENMTGKSFLDVGCWEGGNCAEAVRRGARRVVGVDLCTSDELARNVEEFGFEFLQLDVLSEKWLELDRFDVVLCSGVLYHVENVISLLFRLRTVTDELLALETATRTVSTDEPVLVFKPSDERTRNPSNWWVPNKSGLLDMVRACGFGEPEVVWERERPNGARVCLHARPVQQDSYERVLPRKAEAMSLAGGSRYYADNLGRADNSASG
jgi:tRNA (mo5U34)-methyltransferase